jgi:hypothetical protein
VCFVGYTLTTSSDNATIGLDFTFTCVTTEAFITFNRDSITVCFITVSNTDGACALDSNYNPNYTYTCNSTTNTYTVIIPGSYLTDSLHGTTWRCLNPFGGVISNPKILYVNGELVYCNYNFSKSTNTVALSSSFVRLFYTYVLAVISPFFKRTTKNWIVSFSLTIIHLIYYTKQSFKEHLVIIYLYDISKNYIFIFIYLSTYSFKVFLMKAKWALTVIWSPSSFHPSPHVHFQI